MTDAKPYPIPVKRGAAIKLAGGLLFLLLALTVLAARESRAEGRPLASASALDKLAYRVAQGRDIVAWSTDEGSFVLAGDQAAAPLPLTGEHANDLLLAVASDATYLLISDSRGFRVRHTLDKGTGWSAEAAAGARRFREPALAAAPGGRVALAWLNKGVEVSVSADYGRTWPAPSKIPGNEPCSCCGPALAFAPNGDLYAAYRQVSKGGVRDMAIARLPRGAKSWTPPVMVHDDGWRIDFCPSSGPLLQADAAGRAHILWWTGREGRAGLYYAKGEGAAGNAMRFAAPVKLAPMELAPLDPALDIEADGRVLVSWIETNGPSRNLTARVSSDGGSSFAVAAMPVPHELNLASSRTLMAGGEFRTLVSAERAAGNDGGSATQELWLFKSTAGTKPPSPL